LKLARRKDFSIKSLWIGENELVGTWGASPWENDAAADWFDELFDKTGLASRVEETLTGDTEDQAPEIRAAAYVLVALGHHFIWPSDHLERHLKLAISRLEEIRQLEELKDATDDIEEEITLLKSRLTPERPRI
jgi:hypothetical protein